MLVGWLCLGLDFSLRASMNAKTYLVQTGPPLISIVRRDLERHHGRRRAVGALDERSLDRREARAHPGLHLLLPLIGSEGSLSPVFHVIPGLQSTSADGIDDARGGEETQSEVVVQPLDEAPLLGRRVPRGVAVESEVGITRERVAPRSGRAFGDDGVAELILIRASQHAD